MFLFCPPDQISLLHGGRRGPTSELLPVSWLSPMNHDLSRSSSPLCGHFTLKEEEGKVDIGLARSVLDRFRKWSVPSLPSTCALKGGWQIFPPHVRTYVVHVLLVKFMRYTLKCDSSGRRLRRTVSPEGKEEWKEEPWTWTWLWYAVKPLLGPRESLERQKLWLWRLHRYSVGRGA